MGRQNSTSPTDNAQRASVQPSVAIAAKRMTINPSNSNVYIKAVDNSVSVVVREIKTKINSEVAKSTQ